MSTIPLVQLSYWGSLRSPHTCGENGKLSISWRVVVRHMQGVGGFTKLTQLHVVTSQFVMFISCALHAWIEDGTRSRPDSCEVNFHLQLAVVLWVAILYL